MFKKVALATSLFVALLIVSTPAHAQNMSAALERMDEIIAEMQALRAEFAQLNNQVTSTPAPTPAVQGASTARTLTMDLSYGVDNADIERIQRLLATDPAIYDHPHVTGFFGPKTEEAIQNFQTRFGLEPVGVIGPATTALLEVFFAAYPDENYPAGVLDNKPTTQVQGASTSVAPTTTAAPTPSASSGSNPADEINVTFDDGEALIEIVYENGNRKGLITNTDDEGEVISFIVSRTVLSEAQVRAAIDFDEVKTKRKRNDEDDAEDALDDADDALDDADDEIDEADENGDDTDWAEDTLEEAEEAYEEAEEAFEDEDWEEAVKKAERAEDLAEKAAERIDEEEDDDGDQGDSDEIDSIEVDIRGEDDTEVTVEYEDDDDYEFDVEEDKKEKIIEEIADELDIDEDDVEDLVEFDFGDIDEIEAIFENDRVRVEIEFESGVDLRLILDEDLDEDEIIEEVAEELDEDEDDIEDIIDFSDDRE